MGSHLDSGGVLGENATFTRHWSVDDRSELGANGRYPQVHGCGQPPDEDQRCNSRPSAFGHVQRSTGSPARPVGRLPERDASFRVCGDGRRDGPCWARGIVPHRGLTLLTTQKPTACERELSTVRHQRLPSPTCPCRPYSTPRPVRPARLPGVDATVSELRNSVSALAVKSGFRPATQETSQVTVAAPRCDGIYWAFLSA